MLVVTIRDEETSRFRGFVIIDQSRSYSVHNGHWRVQNVFIGGESLIIIIFNFYVYLMLI